MKTIFIKAEVGGEAKIFTQARGTLHQDHFNLMTQEITYNMRVKST